MECSFCRLILENVEIFFFIQTYLDKKILTIYVK
ncbi:MAG: hypothetical protein H6Q68_2976 [Firmicutes bacterium]|nr:hypothetical protein [Bacillota bacterium]